MEPCCPGCGSVLTPEEFKRLVGLHRQRRCTCETQPTSPGDEAGETAKSGCP